MLPIGSFFNKHLSYLMYFKVPRFFKYEMGSLVTCNRGQNRIPFSHGELYFGSDFYEVGIYMLYYIFIQLLSGHAFYALK